MCPREAATNFIQALMEDGTSDIMRQSLYSVQFCDIDSDHIFFAEIMALTDSLRSITDSLLRSTMQGGTDPRFLPSLILTLQRTHPRSLWKMMAQRKYMWKYILTFLKLLNTFTVPSESTILSCNYVMSSYRWLKAMIRYVPHRLCQSHVTSRQTLNALCVEVVFDGMMKQHTMSCGMAMILKCLSSIISHPASKWSVLRKAGRKMVVLKRFDVLKQF